MLLFAHRDPQRGEPLPEVGRHLGGERLHRRHVDHLERVPLHHAVHDVLPDAVQLSLLQFAVLKKCQRFAVNFPG